MIIIIICILILLSPLFSDLYYFSCDKSEEKLNNIKFRTGDLLLCRYNKYNILQQNTYDNNLQFFWNNLLIPNKTKIFSSICGYYSHISIIIVINDIPYIYDITLHEYSTKLKYDMWTKKYVINKPALLNIDYIKSYPGDIYHVPYIGSDTVPNSVIENILNKYRKYEFNIFDSILSKISLGLYQCDSNKKVSCVSFITNVLYDMGIIDIPNKQNPTINYVFNECINSKTHLNNPIIIKF